MEVCSTYWVVGWEWLRQKRKRRREKWRWWRFLTSGSDGGGALRLWARWGGAGYERVWVESWRVRRMRMLKGGYVCDVVLLLQKWREDYCVRELVWERKSKSKRRRVREWKREREIEVVWVLGEKDQMVGGTGPTTLQNDCDRWVPTWWIVWSRFKQTKPLISVILHFNSVPSFAFYFSDF